MIAQYKASGDRHTVCGFVLMIVGGVLGQNQSSVLMSFGGLILGLVGGIQFVVGCSCLARARGRHGAWGLLGILSLIGYFIILIILRDKAKKPAEKSECMAWNHSVQSNEIANKVMPTDKGLAKEKKPMIVLISSALIAYFALWRFVGIFTSFPYPYQPWRDYVSNAIVFVALFVTLFVIARRNLITLLVVIATQLYLVALLSNVTQAIILAGIPLLLLAFPKGRSWLKANGHFSKRIVGVGIFLACAATIVSQIPCVNEKYIADTNPIWLFNPGNKPMHKLNDSNAHEYDYWEGGTPMGRCVVQYNQNKDWCYTILSFFNPGSTKELCCYDEIVQNLKAECEDRFKSSVRWSVNENGNCFPSYFGKANGKIEIDIFSPDRDDVLCSFVVSDRKLSDELLKEQVHRNGE